MPSSVPARTRVLVFVLALGCASSVNPATGRREVVLMSAEDEQHVDVQASREIEATVGIAQEPELNHYVDALGRSLASHSPRRDVPYSFQIVEMDEPNAFALPGGHIYVSRGLLLLANTEAELAHVLGHEIGHVAARHAAKLDAHVKTLGIATLLGNILSGSEEETHSSETAGANPIARYARDQERQADSIGQQIASEAGVDPSGMARFLAALDNYTKLNQGFSMPQTYWSTHPATRERMAEAAARAQTESWKATATPGATKPYQDERDAYLDKIEGMSVKRPASEGVFIEDRFFHADLGFSLRFPYGWETSNEPARVMAIAPKRDGVVLLELQGAGSDPIAAAREYAEVEALPLENGTPFHIGDLPAFRAVAIVPTGLGVLNAEITWVVFDNRIYRLLGGTSGAQLHKYQGLFRKFAQSFRRITPEEAASIEELRVRTARALPNETLAQLSARTHNEWDLTFTSVANGVFAHEALAPNQRIKIAVKEHYERQPTPETPPAEAPTPTPTADATPVPR